MRKLALPLLLAVALSGSAALVWRHAAPGPVPVPGRDLAVRPAGAGAKPPGRKPHVYRAAHAVCVGIETYGHGLPATLSAERDAQAVAEVLRDRYRFTTHLLLGKDATRARVLGTLEAVGASLGPDDALVVFFAGHGQVVNLGDGKRAGYLIPHDADLKLEDGSDPARWQAQGIDMQGLLDRANALAARHVVVVADACCSGFMGRRGGLAARWDLQELATQPSRTVLAATTQSQAAVGDGRRQHGVFTQALLQALDSPEAASATDVFVRVREQVVRESNRSMTPQLNHFGPGSGEFIFLPDALDDAEVRRVVDEMARANRLPPDAAALRSVASGWLKRANLEVSEAEVVAAFEGTEYRYGVDAPARAAAWEARYRKYDQAAALGQPLGMAALYYCVSQGLGVAKSADDAGRLARSAYQTGTPAGKHVMGRAFWRGEGVPVNRPAGDALIREAAAQGFPISLLQTGMERSRAGDYAGARADWGRAAAAGVRRGRLFEAYLGLGYIPGELSFPDIVPDPQSALRIALPEAHAGHLESQRFVATVYSWYKNTRNTSEATRWLELAASAGDALAQGWLAQELSTGVLKDDLPLSLGLKKDLHRARELARLSASQECGEGYIVLACMSESGVLGLAPNYAEARKHCDQAIALNDSGGLVLMSLWRAGGRVVKKDADEAARLALQAAEYANPRAYYWAAALYMDGDIPEHMMASPDFVGGKLVQRHFGLHYFTLAARYGYPSAEKCVRELAAEYPETLREPHWKLFKSRFPASWLRFWEVAGLPAPDL